MPAPCVVELAAPTCRCVQPLLNEYDPDGAPCCRKFMNNSRTSAPTMKLWLPCTLGRSVRRAWEYDWIRSVVNVACPSEDTPLLPPMSVRGNSRFCSEAACTRFEGKPRLARS